MNELELIARLTPSLPVNATTVLGAGDDCAVLDPAPAGHYLLFKTDAVVEGIHFTDSEEPRRIGHKALARCLSDIAAMGGTPTHALVTIALPREFDPAKVEAIYSGINTLALRYGVGIVGGETTTNPERLLISISVLGTVPREKLLRRSGALAGDVIFVTGELGGSREGRHLDFEPRLAEARWLAGHFDIHAMIDLSDGLASDLRHLMTAGGVGADLLSDAIPISRAARTRARAESSGKPPLLAALTDGEDFELLFALKAGDAVPLVDAWKKQFPGVRLSCIGRITVEPGLRIRDRKGLRPLGEHGYVHFQKS